MGGGPTERIPMVVLGGWLGAGKTTLINRLLRAAHDERIAVVVNDIGEVNLDAELVTARDGDTVELTNGCVCCSMGESLALTLRDLVLSERPPDRLVVEASGVADPDRVAAYGDRRRIRPDGVVVAVDAVDVIRRAADPTYGPLVCRQATAADLLVVTKADLTTNQAESARRWCTAVAPGTPVVVASDDDGWVSLAFGELDVALPVPGDALDVPVAGATWTTDGTVDVEAVVDVLEARSDRLLRAKGVLTDRHGWSVAVHLAGGRVTVDPFAGAASGRLVAVAPSGSLDTGQLAAALDSTRSPSRSDRDLDQSTTGGVSQPC